VAKNVNEVMKDVPGVVDLSVEQQTDIPTLRVKLDQAAAARYGVRAGDVTTAIQTAFVGSDVGQVLEGQIGFPLVVRVQGESPSKVAQIAQTQIDTPSG
jgi:HME family heavy-metal exporter